MKYNYYYIIEIQYIGFRYHGWFYQPDVKTVQMMINKTLSFLFNNKDYKTLGASRTDSKVSANQMFFELFTDNKISNKEHFVDDFNNNLPNDIKVVSIKQTTADFNILQAPKNKEYIYLFAFGEKPHPFSAPLISTFSEDLDIEMMIKGALLFEGKHNFANYCSKPSKNTILSREITLSCIKENNIYVANFFPKKTYAFHIHSNGFLRYQVRLIMGQLIRLGKNQISLEEIKYSLQNESKIKTPYIAPASGLILNKTNIDLK